MVGLRFVGAHSERSLVDAWLPRIGRGVLDGMVLVQACNNLFTYRPVLERLQSMTQVPLAAELVLRRIEPDLEPEPEAAEPETEPTPVTTRVDLTAITEPYHVMYAGTGTHTGCILFIMCRARPG